MEKTSIAEARDGVLSLRILLANLFIGQMTENHGTIIRDRRLTIRCMREFQSLTSISPSNL